jgi:hypothetical protein
MSLKVALLTKPYPLATVLERRLATTGCLVGVVHEKTDSGWRGVKRDAQRLVKRLGAVRALDVVAYQISQRLFRARELRRNVEAVLPTPAPHASGDVPRASFPTLNAAAVHRGDPRAGAGHARRAGTGILKPETFGLAPLVVNLHCGVLPEYRGHDSTFWAMHAGDFDRVGASLHVIDAGVDTGSLIAVARVPCRSGDSDLDAWIAAFAAGIDLAIDLVETLRDGGALTLQPRVGEPGKHYGRKELTDYLALARRRHQAISAGRLAEAR